MSFIAFLLIAASAKAPCVRRPGSFARHTVSLWQAYGCGRTMTLRSPDGRSRAIVDPRQRLIISGRAGEIRTRVAYGPNGEMGWSPDSRSLFVTENDGGAAGGYGAFALVPDRRGRLVRRDLTALIVRTYRQPGRCYEPEAPNVIGLGWLDNRRLVVVGQTYPHSNCDAFGSFTAYVVDPARPRVLETVPQPRTRARFAALMGPGVLAQADDACGRRPLPAICMIPDLHPELFDADGNPRPRH